MTDHAKPEEAAAGKAVPSTQAEAVARVLDRLSEEIKQAAVMLRGSGDAPVLSSTPDSVVCDPWSVIDLVTYDLARRGIKSQFGSEVDLSTAAQAATRLLEALGLNSVARADDERACYGQAGR